jgi:hypothetical protein
MARAELIALGWAGASVEVAGGAAVRAPMPLVPPVITATLPSRTPIIVTLPAQHSGQRWTPESETDFHEKRV